MENPKSGSLQFVSVLYAFPDINGKFIPTVVHWSPFIRVHQDSIINMRELNSTNAQSFNNFYMDRIISYKKHAHLPKKIQQKRPRW